MLIVIEDLLESNLDGKREILRDSQETSYQHSKDDAMTPPRRKKKPRHTCQTGVCAWCPKPKERQSSPPLFRARMYRLVRKYDDGRTDGDQFMNGIVRAMKKCYKEGITRWKGKVIENKKATFCLNHRSHKP